MSKNSEIFESKSEKAAAIPPEWDMSDIEAPNKDKEKPKAPEIQSIYHPPKEEVGKINFFVDYIQRGEQSAIYSGSDGHSSLISEYMSDETGDKIGLNSETINNNKELKNDLSQLLADIAIIDATQGRALDNKKNGTDYYEALNKILYKIGNNEYTDEETDALKDCFKQLDGMGNAFSLLLFRSQEDLNSQSEEISENAKAFKDDDEEEDEATKAERQAEALRINNMITETIEEMRRTGENIEDLETEVKNKENLVNDELQSRQIDTIILKRYLQQITDIVDQIESETNKLQEKNFDLVTMLTKGRDLISDEDAHSYTVSSDQYDEQTQLARKKNRRRKDQIEEIKAYIRRIENFN